jgi:drug/metabolite transporter (DMT)-like permease
MKITIKLFGILVLLIGVILLIKPEIIVDWIEGNKESRLLYLFAIVARLVIGFLFIITSKESKYPRVIKFFGYLFVIAALVLIFIGYEIFQDFITSLIPDVTPFAPMSGLLCIAFGGFLIYAYMRNNGLYRSK